jgi:hypothetical protein
MKRKIVVTIATFLLIILPFLLAMSIGKYSPYALSSNFQKYVVISAIIPIAVAFMVLTLRKYLFGSSEKISLAAVFLFFLLYPLVGIFGLASAPDISLKMLEHPEREHLRYSFLFIALLFFSIAVSMLFRSGLGKVNKMVRWIIVLIFIISVGEFIWEFNHHYLFPEALQAWVKQGKNIADFDKSYDNNSVLTMGVIGRYFQFVLVIWLTVALYRWKQIKIWCLIVNMLFSLLGIISATTVCITKFPFPKELEFLMLFFIPGIPFFLLYWLGVALLTTDH